MGGVVASLCGRDAIRSGSRAATAPFSMPEDLEGPQLREPSLNDRPPDRWNGVRASDVIDREFAGQNQRHSRWLILQRMLSHDSYHAGELSQTLGIHGLPQIDLWRTS